MGDDARNVNELRARAQAVQDRARNDDAFLRQLKSDPEATLQAAGFSLDEAREFGRELRGGGEVSGYQLYESTCYASCQGWFSAG